MTWTILLRVWLMSMMLGSVNGLTDMRMYNNVQMTLAMSSLLLGGTLAQDTSEEAKPAEARDVDEIPKGMTRLDKANNLLFPLVGLGVGNLHPNDVSPMIEMAPEQLDNTPLMLDTSHKSGTEEEVAKGILAREKALGPLPSNLKRTYHVITKVWYTYLGYERTKISVLESMRNLKSVLKPASNLPTQFNVKLTILLHWPKCYEEIEWMDCEDEENSLPSEVKRYKSPLSNPEAYLDSWRALEELFIKKRLDAIGISNFGASELEKLLENATVTPHIHQMNLWTLFHNQALTTLMQQNTTMVYQVYNVMSLFGNAVEAPGAYRFLWELGRVNGGVDPITAGLAWFLQHHISVIPRTTNFEHLKQNSIESLLKVTKYNDADDSLTYEAMQSLMDGADSEFFHNFAIEQHQKEDYQRLKVKELSETVETKFVNRHDKPVQVFWLDVDNEELHPQAGRIRPGGELVIQSHENQVFHAYEAGSINDNTFKEFRIKRSAGETEIFHIEL